MHSQRVSLNGSLESNVLRFPKELLGTGESLSRMVDKNSFGCWLWKGTLNNKGYGSFYSLLQQRTIGAHRASYELFVGAIPVGKVIDHKYAHLGCPRHCVNPEHLRPITYAQNGENLTVERKSKSGYRNIRLLPNGKYLPRLKKNGVEYYKPPTESLELALVLAKELRSEHFTHVEVDKEDI